MTVLDLLPEALPELIELRRHRHAHPELSGEEHQTAALVAGELRRAGWRVREGVGRTGVLAELGPDHGPTVGRSLKLGPAIGRSLNCGPFFYCARVGL